MKHVIKNEAISEDNLKKTSQWIIKAKKQNQNKLYKLLIVDDQPDIRNLIAYTLDSENYEIHHANNWQTAIALAKVIHPDLMILDVMMPGEHDGLHVCRKIKADDEMPPTTILLISARCQAADKHEGMLAGADDFISKPFSPLFLIEKVALLLADKETS